MGKTTDALLLQMFFELGVRPCQLILARFEDVFQKANGMYAISFTQTRFGSKQPHIISAELYEEIQKYKAGIMRDEKLYNQTSRNVSDSKIIKGHFIFNLCRDSILRRLRTGFGKAIPGFSCTPTDILRVVKKQEENPY